MPERNGIARELVDIVHREFGLGVVGGGSALTEHLGGEFVSAGVAGLQLVGRDDHVRIAFLRLEHRQHDVVSDLPNSIHRIY